MKRYLFGLTAMLVGAGLMFVFTHTEVSAESEANIPERVECSLPVTLESQVRNYKVRHCETKTLDCVVVPRGVSCVKKGMFK